MHTFALVTSCLLTAQGADHNQGYLRLVTLAEEARSVGDFARARTMCQAALSKAPEAPLAWLNLALAEAQAGSSDAALEALLQAALHGYRDHGYLYHEALFQPLAADGRFQNLALSCRAPAEPQARPLELVQPVALTLGRISPDDQRLLMTDLTTRQLFLVDATNGRILAGYSAGGDFHRGRTFDPTGAVFLTSDKQRGIVARRAADGGEVLDFDGELSTYGTLSFSPEGDYLLCHSEPDLTLFRWPSGELVKLPDLPPVFDAFFEPAGARLIVESRERIQRIDVESCSVLWSYPMPQMHVAAFAIDPGGQWLACRLDDYTAVLLDIATGQPLWRHDEGWDDSLASVNFHPTNGSLACYHESGKIQSWQPPWTAPSGSIAVPGDYVLASIDFVGDGRVAIVMRESNPIYACDAQDGKRLWEVEGAGVLMWWSRLVDSKGRVAILESDNLISFLDPITGEREKSLDLRPGLIEDFRLFQSGELACLLYRDGRISLFDLSPKTETWLGWEHAPSASFAGVSHDGSWFVTTNEERVCLWRPGEPSARLQWFANRAILSPSDDRLLLIDGDEVWIVSTRDGAELQRFSGLAEGASAWTEVAWSTDGAKIACAFQSGGIQLLSTSGETRALWRAAAPNRVTDLLFTLDNSRLVASLDSGALIEWDAQSGANLREMDFIGDGPSQLAFSQDGRELWVLGKMLWAYDPQSWEILWSGEAGPPWAEFEAQVGFELACFAPKTKAHYPYWLEPEKTKSYVLRAPENVRELSELGLTGLVPAAGGTLLLGLRDGCLVAIDSHTLQKKWTMLGEAGAQPILIGRGLYLEALPWERRNALVTNEGRTCDLESIAADVFAPRLAAAQAAGIPIPALPANTPPRLEPRDLWLHPTIPAAGEISLVLDAQDESALLGFEVELEDSLHFVALDSPQVSLNPDSHQATLTLALQGSEGTTTKVRVRALDRKGGLSAPFLTTIAWSRAH